MTAVKVQKLSITMGSDPEFFLAKRTMLGRVGAVVGSERAIPEEGMLHKIIKQGRTAAEDEKAPRVIRDGFQVEINPLQNTCRQSGANDIAYCFRGLATVLKEKGYTINFSPTVKVTKKEMESLSNKSRMFGCTPSKNAYGEVVELPDPETYLIRAAGGHIHLGTPFKTGNDPSIKVLKQTDVTEVIKILDIIAGNTCVLVDRDPGNIERRKAYGRAGEYRQPSHGIEYRVLSNFWLRNYTVMSMAFGLCRMAIEIAAVPEAAKAFLKAVKEKDIQDAINNNDFELAKKNFNKIKPLIEKYMTDGNVLCKNFLENFEYFITKDLKYWFKQSPLAHWSRTGFSAMNRDGWERFIGPGGRVEDERLSETKKA